MFGLSQAVRWTDDRSIKKYFCMWMRDPHHARFWILLLRDYFVTAHITSTLLHKIRDVLQQEICFIKSNNWLTRFPSSPESHTGGLNIPHMQRDSSCKAFTACLKIWAVKSKRRAREFLSDWVRWFPCLKVCLPFFGFVWQLWIFKWKPGKLCLDRDCSPSTLREWKKKKKSMVRGMQSKTCTVHENLVFDCE